MRLVYGWVMTMVAAGVLSCADDGSDDTSAGSADGSEGGGSTEAPPTSSSTASETSSEGSTAASSEGSTTSGATTACGDALTCAAGEVCVQEPFERPCDIVGEGETCPPDQMPSMCGGAGVPCCCGEPPPPEYMCVLPEGCDGPPTCECIPCEGDRFCSEPVGDGPFVCELLAEP